MDSKRGLPVLALFQSDGQTIDIKTRDVGAWEPLEFDIRRYYNDDRIYEILAEIRPQVFISIGENSQWNNLLKTYALKKNIDLIPLDTLLYEPIDFVEQYEPSEVGSVKIVKAIMLTV